MPLLILGATELAQPPGPSPAAGSFTGQPLSVLPSGSAWLCFGGKFHQTIAAAQIPVYAFSLSLQQLTYKIPNVTVSASFVSLHHGWMELADMGTY